MSLVLKNIGTLATFRGNTPKQGAEMSDLILQEHVDVLIENGRISAIGQDLLADEVIDCAGKTVLPGYVDSHTHLVFGGDRAREYGMRLRGASYLEIMQAGGGIQSTVRATRSASVEDFLKTAKKDLQGMLSQGVTTIEAKSGYGLDLESELRQIEAMEILDKTQPVSIRKTFMGAHEIAPEFEGEPRAYLEWMVKEVLPKVKGRVDFIDIFTEKGVFEIADSEWYLNQAKARGFDLKVHADEIFPLGGAEMAARVGAVSADHLLKISGRGIEALKASGTIATLLPLTAFSIKSPYAPARSMIDAGLAVALSTDYNPGSSHSYSVPLMIALATVYMKMTTAEVLCALTLNAACAVKAGQECGTIEVGKYADLTIHDVKHPDDITYLFAVNTVEQVIKQGVVVYDKRRSYV